jgi:hypothetical protein
MFRPIPPLRRHLPELDQVIGDRGGIFLLADNQSPEVASIYDTLALTFGRHRDAAEKQQSNKPPTPIEFSFIADTTLQAFAWSAPSKSPERLDFIGISAGAPLTLLTVFHSILAHPETFPDVGNPNLEVRAVSPLLCLPQDVIRSVAFGSTPACPVRQSFANELLKCAMNFLFFHELTHLLNGHTLYLQQLGEDGSIAEMASTTTRRDVARIRQTMELDADAGGLLLSLNEAFLFSGLLKTVGSAQLSPADHLALNCAYGSAYQATRTLSFAAYTFFRLFDTTYWMPQHQALRTHPLPPVRMFLIEPTLYEIFKQRPEYEYSADDFLRHNRNTIVQAEIALGLIQDAPADFRSLESVAASPELSAYLEEFEDSWADLRPLLSPFSRGGKLAPAVLRP